MIDRPFYVEHTPELVDLSFFSQRSFASTYCHLNQRQRGGFASRVYPQIDGCCITYGRLTFKCLEILGFCPFAFAEHDERFPRTSYADGSPQWFRPPTPHLRHSFTGPGDAQSASQQILVELWHPAKPALKVCLFKIERPAYLFSAVLRQCRQRSRSIVALLG